MRFLTCERKVSLRVKNVFVKGKVIEEEMENRGRYIK